MQQVLFSWHDLVKNVVNIAVKFTIDHYLIRESRFKNEKYCSE